MHAARSSSSPDAQRLRSLIQQVLGLPEATLTPEQGVEAAAVLVGDGRVELLSPLGGDTPVGRFLASRGEVRALTGEDSGSVYLAQARGTAFPSRTLAGTPANAQ